MHLPTPLLSLLAILTLASALPLPQKNPVDVVSNSVSPLSANDAGNSNSNTGLLDGNSKRSSIRKRQADAISNSLSPGSDNVAGNGNENTGTLDGDLAGNTIEVDPTFDPTINVR